MYCHIISRSFHKFRIFILIFKIINFPPISLKIINLMENICISLTYYVLNIFDCIKLIHSMETTFESLCFIIICSLGNFHHYVSYVIIFILLITLYYILFTIHYKSRYINIAFTLSSLIVYPAFMLICVLDCLSNSNGLVMFCCVICALYTSIINPLPHVHVHLNRYPLIIHLNKMSIFNEHKL